jgi:hypothetical protein
MAITPYLKGPYYFDLETRRALGAAFEMACIGLHTGYGDDHVRRAIADKLIALAKTGERDPNVLCDRALEDICKPRPPLAESRSSARPSSRFRLLPAPPHPPQVV